MTWQERYEIATSLRQRADRLFDENEHQYASGGVRRVACINTFTTAILELLQLTRNRAAATRLLDEAFAILRSSTP